MEAPAIPKGAHKAAHYWFGNGKQLQVYHYERQQFIRDENGEWPVCPIRGVPCPHPIEEEGASGDDSYDTLGLYYDYPMPHSGWSGDC